MHGVHLEQLTRDRVLRVRTVQGKCGDARMRRQRLKKGFMSVNSREGPPDGEQMVPVLGGCEERSAKRHASGAEQRFVSAVSIASAGVAIPCRT
jgi:hypothetical protein